jgi:hypothetical protein
MGIASLIKKVRKDICNWLHILHLIKQFYSLGSTDNDISEEVLDSLDGQIKSSVDPIPFFPPFGTIAPIWALAYHHETPHFTSVY